MRYRRWYDWLLPILLGLPLTAPFWKWGHVSCTHDGHLHYHRVAALKYMWEQGLLFSRWMPDLAFGYGYPFFLYREPLPLYFVLLPHLMGLPLPAATNLFYALCLLCGGVGMFLWVRDLFGVWSGLVSGMAYMASPYILIDALIRGNSPESLGLAMMPWILWLSRRFLIDYTRWSFLGALIGLMMLGLSHNISVLLFAPSLTVYLLCLGWLNRMKWRVTIGRTFLLLTLGFGLTIWYTGAAVLELDEVTITQSTTTRNNDFHFNYATIAEIVSFVQPEDRLEINRPLPIRIGWMPIGLAVIGLLSIYRQRGREQRGHIALMGIAAVLFLLMTLETTNRLWETLPLIDFVQFPWRFVGRMALPVALLAGVAFADREDVTAVDRQKLLINPYVAMSLLAILLLFLEAIPYLYPVFCDEELFPTIGTVHTYERRSGLVGVDPEGSYFPKSVAIWPTGSVMEPAFVSGDVIERFIGDGVISATYEPNHAIIEVETAVEYAAEYLTFYFPGWSVFIDGERVPIQIHEKDGTILFDIPAGRHTIVVEWGWTTTRLLLAWVSGLIGIISILFAWKMNQIPLYKRQLRDHSHHSGRVQIVLIATLVMAGGLLLVSKNDSWLAQDGMPTVEQDGDGLRASELTFLGYNLGMRQLKTNGTIDIDMAWLANTTPASRYQSAVWLADKNGQIWSDKNTFRPRLYESAGRTDHWLPGHWAWDSHEIRLLSGTPAGTYDIVLTLFEQETLQPLTFIDAVGVHEANRVIGQIEIDTVVAGVMTPQFVTTDHHHIIGFDLDRREARPGDPVLITIYGAADLGIATLALLDDAGTIVQHWEVSIGERVRTQALVRLDAALEGSRYQFMLNEIPLGDVVVEKIDRLMTMPPETQLATTLFDKGIKLLGYIPTPSGIDIVWQNEQMIETSYRVFVHLVDDAGNLVSQSDSEPDSWNRPTTSWKMGEFILDQHTLAGDGVAWRVGLYDPISQQRLTTADGHTFVTIPR